MNALRTTPPRPVDVTALFPPLAPPARTTTRLHPRPGSPTVRDSSGSAAVSASHRPSGCARGPGRPAQEPVRGEGLPEARPGHHAGDAALVEQ